MDYVDQIMNMLECGDIGWDEIKDGQPHGYDIRERLDAGDVKKSTQLACLRSRQIVFTWIQHKTVEVHFVALSDKVVFQF